MFNNRIQSLSDVIANGQYLSKNEKYTEYQAINFFQSLLLTCKKNRGIAYIVGNGGSAAIASHFCVDLVNAVKIPAQTLYDFSLSTCMSNDFGYEEVFSRPLECLLNKNDLLICISSSGTSPNIINAARKAKEHNIPLITLTGFDSSNPLNSMGDLSLHLPCTDYGLIETGHAFLLHTIIDTWTQNLTLKKEDHLHFEYAK